jgi:hypothetical protein
MVELVRRKPSPELPELSRKRNWGEEKITPHPTISLP